MQTEVTELAGIVVHGRGLGRTVGMPTANLAVPGETILPAEGVYAAKAVVAGGTWPALVNIGRRPSVDDEDRVTIEAHLLGFDRDIYGEKMTLLLGRFIRPVMKFASLNEVKEQVNKDIKAILSGGSCAQEENAVAVPSEMVYDEGNR